MAIERFPIEAGHIMMFARAIGDPNPVVRRRGGRRGARRSAASRPRRRSCRRAPSSTPTTCCGRSRASRGSARAGTRPARRPACGRAAAEAAARRSTPSSTTSTTGRCVAGDVLTRDGAPGRARGRRRAARRQAAVHRDSSPSTATQHGELVVTARTVAVRTGGPVEQGGLTWRRALQVGDTEGAAARRRPHPHADRDVRRRVGRLQPAAQRRDVRHARSPATRASSPTACSPWA